MRLPRCFGGFKDFKMLAKKKFTLYQMMLQQMWLPQICRNFHAIFSNWNALGRRHNPGTALVNGSMYSSKLKQELTKIRSKQHHYDFGLRNIKSVLGCAGALKRKARGCEQNLRTIASICNLLKFDFPIDGHFSMRL